MNTVDAPLLSHLIPTVPAPPTLTITEAVEAIEDHVAIRPQRPSAEASHVVYADEQWGWQQLRDYVITEIEKVVGVFPRQEPYKEKAIFEGFLNRWGAQASAIARYAFEVSGGYWKNAPISVNRFCRGSDEYFSAPIAQHLREVIAARAARV